MQLSLNKHLQPDRQTDGQFRHIATCINSLYTTVSYFPVSQMTYTVSSGTLPCHIPR